MSFYLIKCSSSEDACWWNRAESLTVVLIAALYLPGFIVFSTVGLSHMTNIKRDFYQDVYTILNRILLTIWTKCAFRVLNPRHWSLAKQRSLESLKEMAYSTYTNRKLHQRSNTKATNQFDYTAIMVRLILKLLAVHFVWLTGLREPNNFPTPRNARTETMT